MISSETGWLDPNGNFYKVSEQEHCKWCAENRTGCVNNKCIMDDSGWFKLVNGEWIICHVYKVTQKQMDFIWDWYILNNVEPDKFIKILKDKDNLN